MRLPCVIASDLHLTASPADEYRWQLFPWLAKECKAENARTLLLLGDLTDAKDYHSAELVNRIVLNVTLLTTAVERVVILMGNHDYLRAGHMYFEFLARLPGVEVVTTPTEDIDGELAMFLPFTRTPATDWHEQDFSHYAYVFMHQTVKGSVASNGQRMEGEALNGTLALAGKVYSGDIHVPQVIGEVEYVGSPYHVHFGDAFEPRCVVIDNDRRAFDLHYPAPRRLMLNATSQEDLQTALLVAEPGDQVKARIVLPEADKHRWRQIAKEVREFAGRGTDPINLVSLELRVAKERKRAVIGERTRGLTVADAVYRYCDDNALGGDVLDVGLELTE